MRIPTMVVAVLVGGLIGCGNGDNAKQQAKNGDMKGVAPDASSYPPPRPENPGGRRVMRPLGLAPCARSALTSAIFCCRFGMPLIASENP